MTSHSTEIAVADIRQLVEYATLAPSGGNVQPWRFVYRDNTLECHRDPQRGGYLDFRGWFSQLALGAAVENITLAAPLLHLKTVCRPFPEGSDSSLVCAVDLKKRPPSETAAAHVDPLAHQLRRRVTNRLMGRRLPLTSDQIQLLTNAASTTVAELRLLTSDEHLADIRTVLGEVDRIAMFEPKYHASIMSELRWSSAEAERTRDGIDVNSLELSPLDRVALGIISRPRVVETIASLGGGNGLGTLTRKWIDCASAVGLLLVSGDQQQRYFEGGRALQRIWLTATGLDIGLHPITTITWLNALAKHDLQSLSAKSQHSWKAIEKEYFRIFGEWRDMTDVFLFRMTRAGQTSHRAMRRMVNEILTIQH
jgi:hypothetical protein